MAIWHLIEWQFKNAGEPSVEGSGDGGGTIHKPEV